MSVKENPDKKKELESKTLIFILSGDRKQALRYCECKAGVKRLEGYVFLRFFKFYFLSVFFLQTFMIHRTEGEGGRHFFTTFNHFTDTYTLTR